jgi:hypothetical protein
MVVGPFQQFPLGNGGNADLYLLRYGDDGRLRSPQTEQILKNSLGGVTDVFVFSHGWNTIFDTAVANYREFIAGYMQLRQKFSLPTPPDYRPVLVGVVWPSTTFVMPWEAGPEIAAAPDPKGPQAAQTEEMLDFVTSSLDEDADAELTELIDGRTALDAEDAKRAAQIVLAALRPDRDPDNGAAPPSVDKLLEAWRRLDGGRAAPAPADADDFGTVGGVVGGPAAGAPAGAPGEPRAAFDLGNLDPRNLLRLGSLWKMKARAGTVGAFGVGPLIRHVLENSDARLHLIGHSFGARVVLSALASDTPARPARSMLLLQPAVNRWCFADDVAGTGRSGGYRPVLDRVEQPVLSTFSSHDVALRQFFQLALQGGHLGEPDIAALGDEELYGALGGYGPAGLGTRADVQPPAVPDTQFYDLSGDRKVVAVDGGVEVDGHPAINGHSDISNQITWWALHCVATQRS